MRQQRSFTDITLLALPAIPTFVILAILATVYIIADSQPSGKVNQSAAPAQSAALSESAALIATVNAAPARQLPPLDVAAASAETGYDPTLVRAGERNYLAVCTACHGTDARGVSGLGKSLINSEFTRSLNDEQLLEFIIVGRNIWDPANTTGVQMPARGGNPGLTDADIHSIIAYIRVLDGFTPDGGVAVDSPPPATSSNNNEPVTFEPIQLGSLGQSSSVEFQMVDVSEFLASLGVSLPDPLPQADRTGSRIQHDVCGIRYPAGGITPEADICSYLPQAIEDGVSGDDLFALLVTGAAFGNNPYGFDVLPRVAYPHLNNQEIQNWLEYLHLEAGKELTLDENIFESYPDQPASAAESSPEIPSSAPASPTGGEAIYNRVCGVSYGTGAATVCDYIQQELDKETSPEAILGVLQKGLSSFAAGNTLGINITPGVTLPALTDAEMQSLIDYIGSLE